MRSRYLLASGRKRRYRQIRRGCATSTHVIVAAAIAVGLIVVLCFCCFGKPDPALAVSLPGYTEVSAEDMFSILEKDEGVARELYLDERIVVVGEVRLVNKDAGYVVLVAPDSSGQEAGSILCYVEDKTVMNYVARKQAGDTLAVRGTISNVGGYSGYIMYLSAAA